MDYAYLIREAYLKFLCKCNKEIYQEKLKGKKSLARQGGGGVINYNDYDNEHKLRKAERHYPTLKFWFVTSFAQRSLS